VDSSKGAPICRWVGHGILLDVMPTNERILGFGNIWYESAIVSSRSYELPGGAQIRLIDPNRQYAHCNCSTLHNRAALSHTIFTQSVASLTKCN
jgi:hypothetical protein